MSGAHPERGNPPFGDCSAPVAVTCSCSLAWTGRPGSSDHCVSLWLSYTRQPLPPCLSAPVPPPGKLTRTPLPRFNVPSRLPPQGRLRRLPHQVGRTLKVADGGELREAKRLAVLRSRALGSATAVTSANGSRGTDGRVRPEPGTGNHFQGGKKRERRDYTSGRRHPDILTLRTAARPASLGPGKLCGLESRTKVGLALGMTSAGHLTLLGLSGVTWGQWLAPWGPHFLTSEMRLINQPGRVVVGVN